MNNTVELLGYYGSDEVIACSAWTSTSRELDAKKKQRIPKLINMLWTNGHETPFEKGNVHFLVNCDIASHIHLLKHRLSSLNAESARYKELKEDKYFIPDDWDAHWQTKLADFVQTGNVLYHQCIAELEPSLGRVRAKESARFFKTYNSQIQADITFNMRSFANFISLRKSEHAQKEIRELAAEMLKLVENIEDKPFKATFDAWRAKGTIV
jgi:thymidylate synthase (FAD)|tara:strand:+ start:409 stop:1041 length:633 start_codon:yes stop_codon:yes gene_type:complete